MKLLIGAKTHFSIGESIYNPKKIIADAANKGYDSVYISDTCNINSLVTITKAGKEHGIKPVIGSSLRVVDDINWRKPKRGEQKSKDLFWMPSVYVKNDDGYKDMAEILTLANDNDHFYFTPRITLSELCNVARRGNVYLTTGIAFSAFAREDYTSILETITDAVSSDNLLIECVSVDSIFYDRVTARALDYSISVGVGSVIVSRPVLYQEGGSSIRTTMNCIVNRDKVDSQWRNEPVDGLHILSPEELMRESVSQVKRIKSRGILKASLLDAIIPIKEFFVTNSRIDSAITYSWEKMDISLPDMASDPFMALFNLTKDGWNSRVRGEVLGYRPAEDQIPIYKERLKYEMLVLKNMGFENYFLLVEKLVSWCREEKILVGPGRGSVGGSLVAFVLGITDVDPIRFNLIFERFINPSRLDLPDIDLDFMSSRREEVIDHLVEVYGEDHVASISNYSELGSSSSLRSVGSAHNLMDSDYRCSKLVPKDAGTPHELTIAMTEVPEIESFATNFPEVWKEAVGLQGTLRSYARHAAGVIVAGEPIVKRAPIEIRNETPTVCWDKRVVEDFGLIKLDILGLSNLDILSMSKTYIKENHGVDMDYLNVSLEDEKVLDAFGKGETIGVFQFECLSGDTMVDGISILDRYKSQTVGDEIRCYDEEKDEISKGKIGQIVSSGQKMCHSLKLKDGRTIKASENHRFFSDGQWKKLKDLKPSDSIKVVKNVSRCKKKG